MSLADDLEAIPRYKPGPTCTVVKALEELDERDGRALRAAVMDRTRAPSDVVRMLATHNIAISRATIGRHRAGDCASCRSRTT